MSNLWRMDSPFMQKMTQVTNLMLVNILWLLCSLPVITMGAATTAMYSVLFAHRRKETDSVFKPFFSAFAQNFWRSTLCWLVLLGLGVALAYDIILIIYGVENQIFLCIPVLLVALLVVITGVYLFPQLALFQNKLLPMIKNGFLLCLMYPFQTVALILLTWLPWILLLCIPQLFWMVLPFWVLLGFSVFAYINTILFQSIFKKYIPQAPEIPEEE